MIEKKIKELDIKMSIDDDDSPDSGGFGGGKSKDSSKSSKTPTLDSFGRDLTKLAEEGKLDPIIGREKEIERVSQILSRRKKNNPVLIGEPGCGKSAIAEGLAQRIVQKKVSRILFNKKIITLDLASMVAGTKYRGQFEERVKSLMSELEKNPDVIVFIDEIHTIVGAGGASGSMDASNMFKPALARGDIQVIGATTLDEYRKNIEKDGALERRFQKVIIEPSSPEETIEIINSIKIKYEDHHNVSYTDEAIKACVSLTNRYMSERHLPDKAIDALDEAGARIHIKNIKAPKDIIDIENKIAEIKEKKNDVVKRQKYEEAAKLRDVERQLFSSLEKARTDWETDCKTNKHLVTEMDVAEVVSMMTGIPVTKVSTSEMNKLSKLGDTIGDKVIGQTEAVSKVVKAIQRSRAGLKDPNRPIGSFIFLGPTGVGKTQLAKVLARELFESEDSIIRIDMSEYMEKFAVSRLIGAPPGYVGHEEGGQLTEKVRRKPYSVVLLDEIEKAHPDVMNLLLQVLDDGQLTDSFGRRIDFKNTIIIMTSNIGTKQLREFGDGIGFGTDFKKGTTGERAKSTMEGVLKKTFPPEFINRLDEIVIFNSLDKENINSIVTIELEKLIKRINALGYTIEISGEAISYIADNGFDPSMGARPLKRSIQKYVEDPLAEEIINSNVDGDANIIITYNKTDDKLNVNVKKKKVRKKKEDTDTTN